jgi:hypothetical protein
MGLDSNGVRFLLQAKAAGVDFSRSATIGRQGLHLTRAEFAAAVAEAGFACDGETAESILTGDRGYAGELLRCLGAEEVDSIDYSDYEGATRIHDMNRDIPDELNERYTMVLDGGSLEHVFNFPVALGNCMKMVAVGGHYLAITPANNFLGHGFYQFSPELFFTVLGGANGYELVELIAFEDFPGAPWYSVNSPASVGGRVTLTNCRPVYLLVRARRVERVVPFGKTPQQSDYVSTWAAAHDAGGAARGRPAEGARPGGALLAGLLGRLPRARRVARHLLMLDPERAFDPRFYRRFERPAPAAPVEAVLRRKR